jgi:hypothetical protein
MSLSRETISATKRLLRGCRSRLQQTRPAQPGRGKIERRLPIGERADHAGSTAWFVQRQKTLRPCRDEGDGALEMT